MTRSAASEAESRFRVSHFPRTISLLVDRSRDGSNSGEVVVVVVDVAYVVIDRVPLIGPAFFLVLRGTMEFELVTRASLNSLQMVGDGRIVSPNSLDEWTWSNLRVSVHIFFFFFYSKLRAFYHRETNVRHCSSNEDKQAVLCKEACKNFSFLIQEEYL